VEDKLEEGSVSIELRRETLSVPVGVEEEVAGEDRSVAKNKMGKLLLWL
jgi:hypothetical protein